MFFSQIKQEEYSPQGTQSAIIDESELPLLSVIRTICNGHPLQYWSVGAKEALCQIWHFFQVCNDAAYILH